MVNITLRKYEYSKKIKSFELAQVDNVILAAYFAKYTPGFIRMY